MKVADDRNAGVSILLTLPHGPDHNIEFSFSKYNVQPNNFTFSQDEYTRFLDGTHLSLHS